MKLELNVNNLQDVISAFYDFELEKVEVENSDLEEFVKHVNELLSEYDSGSVQILEG